MSVPWNSQSLDKWSKKHAQGEIIDLDGRPMHYIERGEGDPVILIHGFFYDTYLWADNIDALAKRFKLYVIDLWGFGYSSKEPMAYGYQLFADQLLAFMDHLGISRASLAGQSMGGGTAIKFTVQHRRRVDKLLLVDAAGLPNPLPFTGKFFALPRVGELLLGINSLAIRKKNLKDVFIWNNDFVTDSYAENVTRWHKIAGSTKASMAVLRGDFFGTLGDEIQQLGQMDVPTLIVWGRHDAGIPLARGEQMHQIVKGSRLEIIENAGHVPNQEQPQIFNQIALDFL